MFTSVICGYLLVLINSDETTAFNRPLHPLDHQRNRNQKRTLIWALLGSGDLSGNIFFRFFVNSSRFLINQPTLILASLISGHIHLYMFGFATPI